MTCSPPGTGGYLNAAGDNLTVNVQSGATVNDNGLAAILLRDRNTITNNGTVTATGATDAINAGADNTVTNNGSITAADGNAIKLGTNTSLPAAANVTNNGTITITNFGFGISVGANHRIVNNGTISAGNGIGIQADTQNVITNNGTITAGNFGIGVQLVDPGNQFYNFGTLSASGGGTALDICGCATGTVAENKSGGVIDGYITVDGAGNTLRNSGLIQVTGSSLQGFPTFLILNQAGFGAANTFVQTSTGTLALRMDNTGLIDNLSADALVPGGTVKIVIQPQLYSSQTFSGTAITISGYGLFLGNTITAPFDHYVSSSPFFNVTPLYDTSNPTSYQAINFQLDRIPFGSVPGATDNQRAVGNVLEPGYSTSLTGALATFYSNLLAATSITVLDQLSGSGTAATQTGAFGAGETFNNTMTQQGLAWLTGSQGSGFGAPLQYAADEKATKPGYEAFASLRPQRAPKAPEWRAWALGFGATRTVDGSSGTASQTVNTGGGAFGVERTFGADLLLGLAAGGSASSFSVSSLSTSGHLDGGHVGGYAVSRWGNVYALATANYAHFENTTDRTITGIGTTESAHGRFGSDQIGGRFELGWRHSIAGYAVTPFVAIEPAVLWQQGYTESSTTATGGAGTLGLNYSSRQTTSLPTFVGAQLDGRYAFGNGQTVRPFLRASWVHEFMPERQISATFVSIPAAGFTVDGARPASDAARFSGGATWSVDATREIFARVDSEFSSRGTMVAGTAGGRITW
ncbi:MAG: autotransporter outer membrane beta-barrel domain-containing protein [Pseudolabrys sp.]